MDYAALQLKLEERWNGLADKPEETPANTLRALWLAAAGIPCSAVSAMGTELPPLDDAGKRMLQALLEKRLSDVPLAHLTGRQHFFGIDLHAGPEALIPRKETELLAQAAIELLREAVSTRASAMAVDACTGSGNLALAIAHNVQGVEVIGTDLSADAIALARRNAETLSLGHRIEFRTGDLLEPVDEARLRGAVDLLVCNPPYISSGKVAGMPHEISGHEPGLAFDGGPIGVSLLVRLLQEAPGFLRAGGWLAFEVGLGQGRSIARRLGNDVRWDEVRECHDESGATRVLLARRSHRNATVGRT